MRGAVDTVILILRWVSQVLVMVIGLAGIKRARSEKKKKNGKRGFTHLEIATVATFIVTFLLFAFTDYKQRNEMSELINESRNRNVTGIEISYTPSNEEWSRIEAAFEKTPRFVAEIPNSAASMNAERTLDNWKIVFGEVKRTEGTVRFPPLLGSDPRGKPFVDVIDAASPSFWIKWGAHAQTEIEPRGHSYPSAIYISQSKVAITLHPPELSLKLNELSDDFSILLRSSDKPDRVRVRSLDDGVILDQTIDTQWREENENPQSAADDLILRTKPYVSGPHKLQVSLKSR